MWASPGSARSPSIAPASSIRISAGRPSPTRSLRAPRTSSKQLTAVSYQPSALPVCRPPGPLEIRQLRRGVSLGLAQCVPSPEVDDAVVVDQPELRRVLAPHFGIDMTMQLSY